MSEKNSRLTLRVDGAARGNPGPASAGVVVEGAGGKVLVRAGRLLGKATNNEAEYLALLAGLEEVKKLGAEEIDIRTDSQLLARQIEGRYKVNAANLRPLHTKAREIIRGFARAEIKHVPREENREADRLANLALDSQSDVYEAESQ